MRISDEKMIAALLSNGSSRAAAVLGCSEATVRNRLANANFRKKYEAVKSDMLQEVCDSIQSRLTSAADTLTEVMKNKENVAAVRVSAADSLLRHGLRYVEAAEIERRIRALEASQEADNEKY